MIRDAALDHARYEFKLACKLDRRCGDDCGDNLSCLRLPPSLRGEAYRLLRLGNRARRLARDLRAEGFNAAADAVASAVPKIEGLPT